MSNHTNTNSAINSTVIDEISLCVYEFIIEVQQQSPDFLREKYKQITWQDTRIQSAFLLKLREGLQGTQEREALILKLRKFLEVLLFPGCFELPLFRELMEQIRGFIEPVVEASHSANVEPRQSALVSGNLISGGIAILLLDAENLQLDNETEKFLAGICTYPIQIKVAFANWRNMGKQDIEFHGRGYELIHVPAGKDSADVKMATVGSSIFVHYPTAREVLVCSSDRVLTHLCNTLQTHGLTVYQVCKSGENITVLNSKTGQVETHSLKSPPEIPTLEEFILQLKEIIKIEQERTGSTWLKLAKISTLFQNKYKQTISEVVAVLLPGKKARDIFIDYPIDFAVHELPNQSQLYITLFDFPNSNIQNPNSLQQSKVKNSAKILSNVKSKEDLEKLLVNLVKSLTNKSPGSFILLPALGSEFHKKYGQPITQVISTLHLGTNFLKFLQTCKAFNLEPTGKTYQVAIRVVTSEELIAQS